MKSRGSLPYVASNFNPNASYLTHLGQENARKPQHPWSPQDLTQDTHDSLSISTDYDLPSEDWHVPQLWSNSSSHTPSPTPASSIIAMEIAQPNSNHMTDAGMQRSFQYPPHSPFNLYVDEYAFERNWSGIGITAPGTTSPHLSNAHLRTNATGIVNPSTPTVYNRITNDGSHSPARLTANRDCLQYSNSNTPSSTGPGCDSEEATLAISTAFNSGSHPKLPSPDVVLVSADQVLFYVHSTILVAAAPQAFQHLLPNTSSRRTPSHNPILTTATPVHLPTSALPQTCLKLDAFPAEELNIVLHAFYNTSSAAHNPTILMLESSIDKMPQSLGISPKLLITPQSALFSLLLGLAPLHPLKVYALAARHDIHDLAVRASSHLLSYSLSSLTDEESERIGAVYLKKLALLHVEREVKLREVLLKPPHPHAPSKKCGFNEQKGLEGMWASVVVELAWDASPNLSTAALQRTLDPLMERLDCPLCRQALETRIKDVMRIWANVKHTI